MESKFETRQCPCCERWFTPVHKRQITCGRLKCQALRAKVLRMIREDRPLDPRIAKRRAHLKAERRREAIQHEAERLVMGLAVEQLCGCVFNAEAQPSIIDNMPF